MLLEDDLGRGLLTVGRLLESETGCCSWQSVTVIGVLEGLIKSISSKSETESSK